MSTHIRRTLFAVAALVLSAGGASAQGYTVRTWGYYDPVPYPPLGGGTYSYTIGGRPTVTLHDPWGRAIDMPIQPKMLYYDTPILTQQGWYRPTSVVVMPNSRSRVVQSLGAAPPIAAPPVRRVEQPPPAASQSAPPPKASVLPDVRSTGPIPTVPVNPPRANPPASSLPPVPKVPDLPDVPKVPGTDSGPMLPKLGPAPLDVPPKK